MQKDAIVLYTSKYGTTRQYAQWIAQALDAACVPLKDADLSGLAEYRLVVYGGYLWAGAIRGWNRLARHLDGVQNLLVFWTGLSEPDGATVARVVAQNFKTEPPACFALRGGMDISRLTWLDRQMMNMLRRMLRKKPELTEQDRGLLGVWDAPVDFTCRDAVRPLLERAEDILQTN